MKKIICILLMLNCRAGLLSAQQFQPLPPGISGDVVSLYADTNTNLLYAAGNFQWLGNGIPDDGISVWNGSNWDTSISTQVSYLMESVIGYNGNIYVAGMGTFNISGTNNTGIGIWNGTNFTSVIQAHSSWGGIAGGFYTHQNNLFVCGGLDSIGGIACDEIARFDGTNWYSYPTMNLYTTQPGQGIGRCIVYQNELYVLGPFSGPNGSNICSLAKFNGTNWVRVGNWPVSGGMLDVLCFHEWNGDLYIGGFFDVTMGTAGNAIVRWDGTNFYPVGSGFSGGVGAMIDFNNELYVGGGLQGISNPSINFISKWDGTQWLPVANFDGEVDCFAKMNNKLYMGGAFMNVNGTTMNFITVYDPSLSITENDKKYTALKAYPNPFKSSLNVATTGAHAEKATVTDITGKTVFEKTFAPTTGLENNYFELCLEDLPKGVYSLSVVSKDKTEVQKIVKE